MAEENERVPLRHSSVSTFGDPAKSDSIISTFKDLCSTYLENKPSQKTEKDIAKQLRIKYPDRTPVVFVPHDEISMIKTKFLIPDSSTMARVLTHVRSQIIQTLRPSESLFVLLDNQILLPLTMTIGDISQYYTKSKGVLYLHITRERVFG
jgi:hypothetical protein